jgi:hypothetical protein
VKLRSVDRAISVQSSNIELGDALPAHARQSILRVAGKYFGRLSTAAVHFTSLHAGGDELYHPSEILAAWNVDVVGDLRL